MTFFKFICDIIQLNKCFNHSLNLAHFQHGIFNKPLFACPLMGLINTSCYWYRKTSVTNFFYSELLVFPFPRFHQQYLFIALEIIALKKIMLMKMKSWWGGFSSKRQFIKMAFHRSGNSSNLNKGGSFIELVSYYIRWSGSDYSLSSSLIESTITSKTCHSIQFFMRNLNPQSELFYLFMKQIWSTMVLKCIF